MGAGDEGDVQLTVSAVDQTQETLRAVMAGLREVGDAAVDLAGQFKGINTSGTKDAFHAVEEGLKGVGEAVEGLKGKAESIGETFEHAMEHPISSAQSLATSFLESFGVIGAGAAVAVTGIVSISGAIIGLGMKGSEVAGVEEGFHRLAGGVENADKILEEMRKGVGGTVTDLNLMKDANKLLGSGVAATAEDFKTLTLGSRVLAKEGGTVEETMNAVNRAMEMGNTKRLVLKGLTVDLAGTEKRYREENDLGFEALSKRQKLEVAREATLDALNKKIAAAGDIELTFRERIQATLVAIENWGEELAKAVAISKPVNEALKSIQDAWVKTFGGEGQTMLETVIGWIEKFAKFVTEWGPPTITKLGEIWAGIKQIYETVKTAWDAVPDWFKSIAKEAVLAGGAMYVLNNGMKGFSGEAEKGAANTDTWLSRLANTAQMWGTWGGWLKGLVTDLINTGLVGVTLTRSWGPLAASAAWILVAKNSVNQLWHEFDIALDHWHQSKSLWEFFSSPLKQEEYTPLQRWIKSFPIFQSAADQAAASLAQLLKLQDENGYKRLTDNVELPKDPPKPPEKTKESAAAEAAAARNKAAYEASFKSLEGEIATRGAVQQAVTDVTAAMMRDTTGVINNAEVRGRLIAAMDKQTAGGVALNETQATGYQFAIAANKAEADKGAALAATNEVTLRYLATARARGETDQHIADGLQITVPALKLLEAGLKTISATEEIGTKRAQDLAKAHDALNTSLEGQLQTIVTDTAATIADINRLWSESDQEAVGALDEHQAKLADATLRGLDKRKTLIDAANLKAFNSDVEFQRKNNLEIATLDDARFAHTVDGQLRALERERIAAVAAATEMVADDEEIKKRTLQTNANFERRATTIKTDAAKKGVEEIRKLEADAQEQHIRDSMVGVERDLALNELKRKDVERCIRLEMQLLLDQQKLTGRINQEAYDNLQKQLDLQTAAYQESARQIVLANDPAAIALKAMREQVGDLGKDFATMWGKALEGEMSWADAALQPFKDLQSGAKKVFAGMMADFESELLKPLTSNASFAFGGIAKALNGNGGGGQQGVGTDWNTYGDQWGYNAGGQAVSYRGGDQQQQQQQSGSMGGIASMAAKYLRGYFQGKGGGTTDLGGGNVDMNGGGVMADGSTQGGGGGGSSMAAAGWGAAGMGMSMAADYINTGPSAGTGNLIAHDALKGASMGTMIMPGIGTAIGAGVGAVVGWIRAGAEWRKTARDIARDYTDVKGKPLEITEEFGRMIEQLEDDEHLGRVQAITLKMDELIKQAGGLSAANIDMFTGKIRDAFVYLSLGQMSVAQATEVMDKNFQTFAAAGTDSTGRLSAGVKELISLSDQFGVHSEAITAYLKGQAAAAQTGFAAVAAAAQPAFDAYDKIAQKVGAATLAVLAFHGTGVNETTDAGVKQVAEDKTGGASSTVVAAHVAGLVTAQLKGANDAVSKVIQSLKKDELGSLTDVYTKALQDGFKGTIADFLVQQNALYGVAKDGDARLKTFISGHTSDLLNAIPEVQAYNKALLDQRAAAEGAKQELSDLGLQAVATYAAAVAAGATPAEALKAAGPALDSLQKAYTDLGIEVDDVALKQLMMQNSIQKAAPTLIAGIAGLNTEMVALDNMGLMNVDTFAAMQRTGMQMYSRLQGAVNSVGGQTRDALLPMQDYLHQAEKEAELLHVPLDDNTQEMIRQSKELGVWKDMNEKNKAPVDKLIDAVQKLVDTLAKVPQKVSTEYNTHYTYSKDQDPGAGGGGSTASTGGVIPEYHEQGGRVGRDQPMRWKPVGTDTVPAMLTPGEGIVSVNGMVGFEELRKQMTQVLSLVPAFAAQTAAQATAERSGLTVNVTVEGSVIAEAQLMQRVRQNIADAVLLTRTLPLGAH